MTAVAAGRAAEGRRHLRLALAHGLAARPWLAQRAARASAGRRGMRVVARLAIVVAVLAGLAWPAGAQAHPLGNFSVNHQARVAISDDRVDVTYLLDQAEVPTFQQRGLGRDRVLARVRDEVARGLSLEVGGRRTSLAPAARRPDRVPGGPGRPADDAGGAPAGGAHAHPRAHRAPA